VDDRAALDEAVARNERHEEGAIGNLEEHAQRPDQERDDEHVRERERVERVRGRERAEQERAAKVGRDHRLPLSPSAVGPSARVEREEQVGRELGGDEVAHLRRARVEGEDRDEWQRDQADLIAEQ
jgi:hypothetical protein